MSPSARSNRICVTISLTIELFRPAVNIVRYARSMRVGRFAEKFLQFQVSSVQPRSAIGNREAEVMRYL